MLNETLADLFVKTAEGPEMGWKAKDFNVSKVSVTEQGANVSPHDTLGIEHVCLNEMLQKISHGYIMLVFFLMSYSEIL